MLKTFGEVLVDGQSLAEDVPVWLESVRDDDGDDWQGTILLDEPPQLAAGTQVLLRLQDGRQAEVVLKQLHPGADGGLLVRFSSSSE